MIKKVNLPRQHSNPIHKPQSGKKKVKQKLIETKEESTNP